MRKIPVLLMVALAVPALAGTIVAADSGRLNHASSIDLGTGSRVGYTVYDNTTNGPTGAFSQNPGALIADDLTLDFTGAPGNILENLAFVVYNSSNSTAIMDAADIDIVIFNYDDVNGYTYNNTVTFTGLTPGLLPGYFTTYTADGLSNLGITLSNDIMLGVQIYNVASGVLPGTVMYDPPTVGLSANLFYLDNTTATPPGTNVGWYWFGGTPVANFYWGVGVVPEPTSLLLLALGGLTLVRRR
jgi:PEP-CTERM motif